MDYPKLVRDKVPELIEETGAKPITHIAKDEEYLQFLKIKLREEVEEFIAANNVEELSDVLEVVDAIIKAGKINREQLESYKKYKINVKGKFDKRIVLDKIKYNK